MMENKILAVYVKVIANLILFYALATSIYLFTSYVYTNLDIYICLVLVSLIHFIFYLPKKWFNQTIKRDILVQEEPYIRDSLVSLQFMYLLSIFFAIPGLTILIFECKYLYFLYYRKDSEQNKKEEIISNWYDDLYLSCESFYKMLLSLDTIDKYSDLEKSMFVITLEFDSSMSKVVNYSISPIQFDLSSDYRFISRNNIPIGLNLSLIKIQNCTLYKEIIETVNKITDSQLGKYSLLYINLNTYTKTKKIELNHNSTIYIVVFL